MVRSCKHKINKLLADYSKLQRESGQDVQYRIEAVLTLDSEFWVNSDHTYTSTNCFPNIPIAIQRRLVELNKLIKRATEEKQLVIAESLRTVEFYFRLVSESKVLIKLQHQRSETVCLALVQSYWSDSRENLSRLRRQCRSEVIVPPQPLCVDQELSNSNTLFSHMTSEDLAADFSTESSSNESREQDTEDDSSSSSDIARE